MAVFQGSHHRTDQLIGHDQLNLPFLDLFDLTCFTQERLTALQWTKLALALHLPCAVIVSADPSATGGEYGTFDHFDMAVGNKKAELVHGP